MNKKNDFSKDTYIWGSDAFSNYLLSCNCKDLSEKDKLIIYKTIVEDKYSYIYRRCNNNKEDTHNIIIDIYIIVLKGIEKYVKNIPNYNPRQRQHWFVSIVNKCISDYFAPFYTGKIIEENNGKYIKVYAKPVIIPQNNHDEEIDADIFDYYGITTTSTEDDYINHNATIEDHFENVFTFSNCCTVQRQISYIFAREILPEYYGETSKCKGYISETHSLLFNKRLSDILDILNLNIEELYNISLENSIGYKEFKRKIYDNKDEYYQKSKEQIRDDIRYIKLKIKNMYKLKFTK